MLNNNFFNSGSPIDLLRSDTNELSIFFINPITVSGRNKVLNYIAGMEFELDMFGFSETSNNIADFYEYTECNIDTFYKNPVIQMILKEIEHKTKLKRYLYSRIFDYIPISQKNMLEYIYNNNEYIIYNVKKNEKIQKKLDKQASKIIDDLAESMANDIVNDIRKLKNNKPNKTNKKNNRQ